MLTLVDAIRFITHALKSLLRCGYVGSFCFIQILVIFKNKSRKWKEELWYPRQYSAASTFFIRQRSTQPSHSKTATENPLVNHQVDHIKFSSQELHPLKISAKIGKNIVGNPNDERIKDPPYLNLRHGITYDNISPKLQRHLPVHNGNCK